MNSKELQAIIEGLLFVAGDDGIDLPAIQEVLPEEKPSTINQIIDQLIVKYSKDETCAFSIQKFHKNKFRLQTKSELHDYIGRLSQIENHTKLSNSVIEVLSVVAYRGPITKGDIDDLRNADSAYQLQKLRDQKLIKAVGKSEENPRANIYQITDNFFKVFNLNGFEDMPKIDFDEHTLIPETDDFRQKTANLKDIFASGEVSDD